MPKPLKPREKKEAKILRATEKLLATRGFHGTRMDDIARAACLPRPNLYYYFSTKDQIYRRIITELRKEWIKALDAIDPGREPEEAIGSYIREKIRYSNRHPVASKIFAKEVISGSDMLTKEENQEIKALTDEKCAVVNQWVEQGKMDPIDPRHLFFLLWGATQYYADFDEQVKSILGVRRLSPEHFEEGVKTMTHIVLKGCGIAH